MSPLALSLHFLQAQPDRRLIELAREGHEPAFEALVRRYRRELLAYCRRFQPHSGTAEDALQQTFLQAWKALRAGAEVREVRPWLYRIAHNVSLNHLRVAVAVPHEVTDAPGEQEVHQQVEQRLQARAALAGMAALPPLQRDVFVSTAVNGASHEEVASALGLSSGAVRGLIYRARATLRSAAAAITPSPVVHWAIRRVENRAGATGGILETIAGGGGASVAAAIAKSGAVLSLAGAVAGAGGLIAGHSSSHHRDARLAERPARAPAHAHATRINPPVDQLTLRPVHGEAVRASRGGQHPARGRPRAVAERSRGPESSGGDRHGSSTGSSGTSGGRSGGETGGRSDGGSSGGPSEGSDGGAIVGAVTSSDGSSGSGSGSSTSTTSGSDGSGPGPSDGGQLTTATTTTTTTDGGSGSDGGSSDGTSGSDATTTTSSH